MAALLVKLNRIAPWRFLLFFALLAFISIFVGRTHDWGKSVMVGFDIAAVIFLATCLPLYRCDDVKLRQVAEENDANRAMLLAITFALSLIVFAAILFELSRRTSLDMGEKGLIVVTLGLVWAFGNMVYTLHYLHLFYMPGEAGKDRGGLEFPGTPNPLLSDFTYFAFTLGVAVQTSDVVVTSRELRKIVTIHCVIGFFFNLGVLALTINIVGSA